MLNEEAEGARRELRNRLTAARCVPETHAAIRWGYGVGLAKEVIQQEIYRDLSRRRLWDAVLFMGSAAVLVLIVVTVLMLC